MTDQLTDTILDKLKELSDNNDEFEMCKKILVLEKTHYNEPDYNFRDQYKKYLNDYFPYDEDSQNGK